MTVSTRDLDAEFEAADADRLADVAAYLSAAATGDLWAADGARRASQVGRLVSGYRDARRLREPAPDGAVVPLRAA